MLKPSVTPSPFNRSAMKKRFSFCANVALGTGTNGIYKSQISNLRSQKNRIQKCPTGFESGYHPTLPLPNLAGSSPPLNNYPDGCTITLMVAPPAPPPAFLSADRP